MLAMLRRIYNNINLDGWITNSAQLQAIISDHRQIYKAKFVLQGGQVGAEIALLPLPNTQGMEQFMSEAAAT